MGSICYAVPNALLIYLCGESRRRVSIRVDKSPSFETLSKLGLLCQDSTETGICS